MLAKGDKIQLVKAIGAFTNVGEICNVIGVTNGIVSFKFGNGMNIGCISMDEFVKYFVKVIETGLKVGDKIIMTEVLEGAFYLNVNTVFVVTKCSSDKTDIKREKDGEKFTIRNDIILKNFKKYKEPKKAANYVTPKRIEEVMNHSKVSVTTVFDKCTVVACQLPSGFVIVESSSCVDPENYNEDMGVEICMNRIKDKVYELEAYKLQEELNSKESDTCSCENCNKPCHCE